MARLDEMAARGEKPSNMVNLLSMDGGGIRGLVILQVWPLNSLSLLEVPWYGMFLLANMLGPKGSNRVIP